MTEAIIAGAIEVHRDKGPGLVESIYEWCLLKELTIRELACTTQKVVLIEYKGFTREEPLRFDVLVEGCVLVEAKAVEKVLPVHQSAALELYEAPERSDRLTYQFPRNESDRRHQSPHPSGSERIKPSGSFAISREELNLSVLSVSSC